MSVGQEDDREEKPALVPSLFAFISPTLYFSNTNEKGENMWNNFKQWSIVKPI